MSEDKAGRLHSYGNSLVFWWRVGVAAMGVGGVLMASWTQFLGPGLQSRFQDFTGVTEIVGRLVFVEEHMPPPRVVQWNEDLTRQIGSCTFDRCVYVLNGARTRYGEECGRPTGATPFLRTASGQNSQIEFDGFVPVELSREPTSFTLPLKIDESIPPGNHQFRVKVDYPNCQGRGEPIPRWTPWFPLEVTE